MRCFGCSAANALVEVQSDILPPVGPRCRRRVRRSPTMQCQYIALYKLCTLPHFRRPMSRIMTFVYGAAWRRARGRFDSHKMSCLTHCAPWPRIPVSIPHRVTLDKPCVFLCMFWCMSLPRLHSLIAPVPSDQPLAVSMVICAWSEHMTRNGRRTRRPAPLCVSR